MTQALKIAGALGAAAVGNQSLYDIISGLGLTTNLKVCLDAGDSASYDPGVQTAKWLDTSGNGQDFYRGSSGAGDAAEPTFNGSAGGLSSAEYFSSDGGDYFLYDTTNETWMDDMHKNNAVWSCFLVVQPSAAATLHRWFATRAAGPSSGVNMNFTVGNKWFLNVQNGGSIVLNLTSTASTTTGWNIVGFSITEATPAEAMLINGTTETFSSAYSSPSAAAAGATMTLDALGGGGSPNPSGNRIACMAFWGGTALTTTNLTDIYDQIKGRFGL